MDKSAYIIVVGCGRLGSTMATRLSAEGHQVVVIDRHEKAFEKLGEAYSGFRVVGDAAEINTLREARIEQASVLFAMTTYDNLNLMVAQVAHTMFDIKTVVARVFDPAREEIYEEFGIRTVSPTILATEAFVKVLKEDNRAPDSDRRG
jgi:trk system potassium uptake protein